MSMPKLHRKHPKTLTDDRPTLNDKTPEKQKPYTRQFSRIEAQGSYPIKSQEDNTIGATISANPFDSPHNRLRAVKRIECSSLERSSIIHPFEEQKSLSDIAPMEMSSEEEICQEQVETERKFSLEAVEDSPSSDKRKFSLEAVEDSPSSDNKKESIYSDILKLKKLKTKHNKKVLEEYQKTPHRKKNDSTYGIFNTSLDTKKCVMKGAINADKTPRGVCEFYKNKRSKTLLAVISYDDNGKKDGKELLFYPNGALHVRASFKNGVQEGKELTYYNNGSIKSIKTYHNNVIAGNPSCPYEPAHIEYYKTGIPSMHVSYDEDGNREGLTLLMDEQGRIIEKQWYENGAPARIWGKALYPNGNSIPYVAETKYKDEPISILDDCQALPKDYDGMIELAHDRYGLLHGEQIYKTTFTLDKSDEFEVDVIKRVHYQHGIKDGETRIESDDNERRLLSTITYKAGLKTTQSIYEEIDEDIDRDDLIVYTRQMKYGLEHGTRVKEISDRKWDDDEIVCVQDSCTKEEVEYRFGQKDGTAKYYDEDNILRHTTQYKSGELDGIAIEYYKDGHHIKNITEYHNDEQNGMEIKCDIDGNITKIEHYVNGE